MGKSQKMETVKDFSRLFDDVRCILDAEYQQHIWVNQEDPKIVDSYDDTTMYFLTNADAVIKGAEAGEIEITSQQLTLLKELYERVEDYDCLEERPDRDADIVQDPRWLEIVAYAKEVYPILSGESSSKG